MLSVAATEYSPCIFDAQFSETRKYPDAVYPQWRLNHIFIRASNSQFCLRNSGSTYILYVSSVRHYMAGTVTCELCQKSATGKSQVVDKKSGKLSVLYPEWFEKTRGSQILYMMNRAVAYLPYITGEPERSASKVMVDNKKKIITLLKARYFVDDNIDTLLKSYVFRFDQDIVYIKIVFDPSTISADAIRVSLKKGIQLYPTKINTFVQIKWTFDPLIDYVSTYEGSDEEGTFPVISPLPERQVSTYSGFRVILPAKNKLISSRVRVIVPLPGRPAPHHKKVTLRITPVPEPSAVAGPSKRAI